MRSRARVPVATKAQISLDAQAIDKVNRITGGKASVGVKGGGHKTESGCFISLCCTNL